MVPLLLFICGRLIIQINKISCSIRLFRLLQPVLIKKRTALFFEVPDHLQTLVFC